MGVIVRIIGLGVCGGLISNTPRLRIGPVHRRGRRTMLKPTRMGRDLSRALYSL